MRRGGEPNQEKCTSSIGFCGSEGFLHGWDLRSELHLIAPSGGSSQQPPAHVEAVPRAWCVGAGGSGQIPRQVTVPSPGSNGFVAKLCINFFLSLSFPSLRGHRGSHCPWSVAALGPRCCLTFPPRCAGRSAGRWGSVPAFHIQVTAGPGPAATYRALSWAQAVLPAAPASSLRDGGFWVASRAALAAGELCSPSAVSHEL